LSALRDTLASHETAQGYEDVDDVSVFVRFKIKDDLWRRQFLGLDHTNRPPTRRAKGFDRMFQRVVVPFGNSISVISKM